MPPTNTASPVARTIDIDLDRVVEEPIEQHRRFLRFFHGLSHVSQELLLFVDDLHRPPAEHVGGANDNRVTDRRCMLHGVGRRPGDPIGRLAQSECLDQLLESLPIFSEIDAVGTGPHDSHTLRLQRSGKLERSLATVLHDHAVGLLDAYNLEDILECERLEIETVRRVVVGRNGLRVAVDHDALVPRLAHCERGLHTAVVELDALPDPVRAATEHDDLALCGRLRLALLLVRRVHVGGSGPELRRARVDPLEHGVQPESLSARPYIVLFRSEQRGDSRIRETLALEAAKQVEIEPVGSERGKLPLFADEIRDLRDEPRIDPGQSLHFALVQAEAQRVGEVPQPLGTGVPQFAADSLEPRGAPRSATISSSPVSPVSRLRNAFCSDS